MKVINPNETDHTLFLTPRKYVTDATLWLRNELKNVETTTSVTCNEIGGFLRLSFEKTVKEGESYELELLSLDNELLYRGKIYVTEKETQNYRLTQ